MSPRLRVLAGTSPSTMTPITLLVNSSRAHHVSSPLFEGKIVVHIKGMTDEKGRVRESEYFERGDPSRAGVTWSIQVQGRFLAPYSADDILFGNTFDRPLKLPWGTSAVLKFMHYIDPTLEHDLTSSSKPWALSPLIATMPHFTHKQLSSRSSKMPPFPTKVSIGDDISELYLTLDDPEFGVGNGDFEFESDGEGDRMDGSEVMNYQRGQTQTPRMVVTSPPVLIPGPIPPIPMTSSRYVSSQSLTPSNSGLVRNGSVSTMNSTSTSSSFFSTTHSSNSSNSDSSSAVSFLGPSSPPNRKSHRSSRLSVSSSVSSSSTGSTSSGSSSISRGSGSTALTSNSAKSNKSSGLSSIRMKTKDVVRKVKGKKSGASCSGDTYETRRKKEEELKSLDSAAQRRGYFASKGKRKDVIFGPEDVITTDFCYGFITFAPSLALQLPGGLSFDLMKYWDGQPVRFVCCERPGISRETSGEPWGRIFWCVAIEIVDDGDEDE